MSRFLKIGEQWQSDAMIHDDNFFRLVSDYENLYPDAVVGEKHVGSEITCPGWPRLCYYKITIDFNNSEDEATFILRESKC